MIVYPAIDIYQGRVVRMTRGDFSTVEEVASSPLEAAKQLVSDGAEWLHIVDIDGARTGTPGNIDAIRQIANRFTVQIQAGGGIRDFDTAEAFAVYTRLLRSATSDRQSDADFEKNVALAAALAADDQSYNARATRAAVLSHRDWLAANEARTRMRHAWAEFFTTYDLLLCPVAGVAAFPHDQHRERYDRTVVVNGAEVPVTDHLFWAGYSGMSYLPSTAAPCGFTPAGLPVGVQIVGPQYGDLTCLAFARLLEREFQAFVPPPAFA